MCEFDLTFTFIFIFITSYIWRVASVRALVGNCRMCGVRTYLLVCLLHGHWHVSKNNAAPFLKDVRLETD